MFDAAWGQRGGRFDDDDWDHAVGGTHVVGSIEHRIVTHASLVPRRLEVDGRPLAAGYVEAVATRLELWGRGHASRTMARINELLRDGFALGALSTGAQPFYERLGWERWLGPTFVRTPAGLEPTPADDGGVMILRTARTPPLDPRGAIVCDWRSGDVW